MTLQKFLTLQNGTLQMTAPVQTGTGASSAGAIPALNVKGQVDSSMLPAYLLLTGGTITGKIQSSGGTALQVGPSGVIVFDAINPGDGYVGVLGPSSPWSYTLGLGVYDQAGWLGNTAHLIPFSASVINTTSGIKIGGNPIASTHLADSSSLMRITTAVSPNPITHRF